MSQQRLDGGMSRVDWSEELAARHTGPKNRVDWVAMRVDGFAATCREHPELLPDMRAAQEAKWWEGTISDLKVRTFCPVRVQVARPVFAGKLFDLPREDYVQYERQNWIGSVHIQRKIAKRALRYCREKHISYARLMEEVSA